MKRRPPDIERALEVVAGYVEQVDSASPEEARVLVAQIEADMRAILQQGTLASRPPALKNDRGPNFEERATGQRSGLSPEAGRSLRTRS